MARMFIGHPSQWGRAGRTPTNGRAARSSCRSMSSWKCVCLSIAPRARWVVAGNAAAKGRVTPPEPGIRPRVRGQGIDRGHAVLLSVSCGYELHPSPGAVKATVREPASSVIRSPLLRTIGYDYGAVVLTSRQDLFARRER